MQFSKDFKVAFQKCLYKLVISSYKICKSFLNALLLLSD